MLQGEEECRDIILPLEADAGGPSRAMCFVSVSVGGLEEIRLCLFPSLPPSCAVLCVYLCLCVCLLFEPQGCQQCNLKEQKIHSTPLISSPLFLLHLVCSPCCSSFLSITGHEFPRPRSSPPSCPPLCRSLPSCAKAVRRMRYDLSFPLSIHSFIINRSKLQRRRKVWSRKTEDEAGEKETRRPTTDSVYK